MRNIPRLGRSALAAFLLFALLMGAAHARQLPGAPTFPTPAQPSGAQAAGKGLVLGLVADAKTGRGVANAVVKLALRGASITRLTDSKGRFYFKDLPAATLGITATKPGFFDGAYGKKRPNGTGMPLVLYENQWITDLKIDLWRPATLSGTVVDENNEPVVGVEVRALRRQFVAGRLTLVQGPMRVTDDQGRYRITGLVPGDYVVSAPAIHGSVPVTTIDAIASSGAVGGNVSSILNLAGGPISPSGASLTFDSTGTNLLVLGRSAAPPPSVAGTSSTYPTVYYPGVADASSAQTVTLSSGDDRQALDLQVRPAPTVRVSGRVTAPTGSLSDLVMRLLRVGAEDLGLGTETAVTIAAPDGTFSLLGVPSGDYTLEARRISSVSSYMTMADGSMQVDRFSLSVSGLGGAAASQRALWGDAPVSVVDRDVTDIAIALQAASTIRGHLAFRGGSKLPAADQLARVPVVIEPASGGLRGSLPPGRVNEDGEFTISGVLPGRYFVRPGSAPLGWFFESAMLNGRDVSDVTLEADSDIDDLVIMFTDSPTTLSGTVRDARGGPVSSATVIAFPADRGYLTEYGANPRRLRNIRVPATGVFSVTGLPAGDYLMVAIDEADADNWQDPARLDAWRTGATRVTLASGETKVQDLRMFTKKQP